MPNYKFNDVKKYFSEKQLEKLEKFTTDNLEEEEKKLTPSKTTEFYIEKYIKMATKLNEFLQPYITQGGSQSALIWQEFSLNKIKNSLENLEIKINKTLKNIGFEIEYVEPINKKLTSLLNDVIESITVFQNILSKNIPEKYNSLFDRIISDNTINISEFKSVKYNEKAYLASLINFSTDQLDELGSINHISMHREILQIKNDLSNNILKLQILNLLAQNMEYLSKSNEDHYIRTALNKATREGHFNILQESENLKYPNKVKEALSKIDFDILVNKASKYGTTFKSWNAKNDPIKILRDNKNNLQEVHNKLEDLYKRNKQPKISFFSTLKNILHSDDKQNIPLSSRKPK